MSNKKRIYISGKITGLNIEVAKQYFESTEKALESEGWIVINPMKLLPFDPNLTWKDYMKEDLYALMHCDAIFMLENWQDSRGARIEHFVAQELGLEVHGFWQGKVAKEKEACDGC